MAERGSASGPEHAKILVVGEAFGAQEEIHGKPFIGPAGQLLRGSMLAAGINPEDVRFTNLVNERPPNNDLGKWIGDGGYPIDMRLINGITELIAEINRCQPNVILTCGNIPTAFLSEGCHWDRKDKQYKGILEWRGSILEGERVGTGHKVLPSLHPSYVLRQRSDEWLLRLDLERAKRQAEFSDVRYPEVERLIDPDPGDREEILQRLLNGTHSPITFDIEFSRRSKRLYCIGVTNDPSWAATIPVRGPADLDYIRTILLSGRPLVAQNAIFDCSILEWHYDIPCLKYLAHDTMIASHALYIEHQKDLGFLCRRYFDYRNYWAPYQDAFWTDLDKQQRSPEEMYEYNNDDVWVTAGTYLKQLEEMAGRDPEDDAARWTFAHEQRLVSALWDVSKRGVAMDTRGIAELKTELEKEIFEYDVAIHTMCGGPLNTKSGKQVVEALTRLGCKMTRRTKKGYSFATDDKTLAEIELDPRTPEPAKALLRAIRENRNRRDLISKFCNIKLDDDQRMRTHYDPAKTVTGRLSSKTFFPTDRGSNMQNPSRDKRVRSKYLSDPGFEFAYSDLERAESLVVAHLTQDPEMLRIHAPGLDAHRITACRIYDIQDEEEVTGDQRYMGKQTRHAGNYMQGWKTFQLNINKNASKTGISVTAQEAKRFLAKYRAMHPGLPRWWNEIENQVRATRTLYNLLGRHRTFFGHLNLPEAVAFTPQSTVGDVLNIGLLRCQASAQCLPYEQCDTDELKMLYDEAELLHLDFQMLMQIHDAIAYQYPISNRLEVNACVRKLLRVELTVPKTRETFAIPVEIAVGNSWGTCTKWEEDLCQAA